MPSDRLHTFASKRVTRWSKYRMPGYWAVLQWVLAAGFGVFVAVQLMSSSPAHPAHTAVALEAQQPAPAAAGSAASPSVAPTTPATSPAAPVSADKVEVKDSTGAAVQVPAQAAQVATAAMKALFDPAVAAAVATSSGGHLPAPAKSYPQATVGPLIFVSSSGPDTLVFDASTDADGPASTYAPVATAVTVTKVGQAWVVKVA